MSDEEYYASTPQELASAVEARRLRLSLTKSPTRSGVTQKNSGCPETARQGKLNMSSIAQFVPANSRRDEITEGFATLTPEQVVNILVNHRHPKQKRDGNFQDGTFRLSVAAKHHIDSLKDLMLRGSWRDRGLIALARIDGHLVLIDGYHRLHAQVAAGLSLEWTIAVYDSTAEEADALFWTFDTVARKRTTEQILGVVGMSDRLGVSKEVATACWRAMPLIAAKFSTTKTDKDSLLSRLPDLRSDMMMQFAKEVAMADAAIKPAYTLLRRRLTTAGRMAVILVTMKYQPQLAELFWSEVAKNDGLRRGDPTHTLVGELIAKDANTGPMHRSYSVPAHAWNAYCQNKQISFIRPGNHDFVRIIGTPFDGKGE